MPFQYRPYQNRHVGTIADLIGRGRNAEARAAQISGQAWGGAIQNIGNTIAAIPGQMQAQQDRELALEDRELLRKQREGSMAYTDARTRELASQAQQRIGDDARAAEEDIRLTSAIGNPDGWNIQDIISAVGVERGIDIATGLNALRVEPPEPPSQEERSTLLKKILQGYSRLSRAMQVDLWPGTRAEALANPALGLDPANIPEVFDEAWFTQRLNFGVEPTAPVAPGSPWVGTLDGEPTVFDRDPEGRMQPIGGGVGPPLSTERSLTADERNREEFNDLQAQGLIPEGMTFPRWLRIEQTIPESPDTTPPVSLIADEQGVVDVPASMTDLGLTPAPHEDKLWDRADMTTTGLFSIPVRAFGPPTGLGEQSMGNMSAIDIVREMATRSLAENPRLAVAERAAIREGIDIDTGWWESPDKVRVKFRELETVLRRALQRKDLIDDIGVILQTIDILGVPAETGRRGRTVRPSGDVPDGGVEMLAPDGVELITVPSGDVGWYESRGATRVR